MYNIELINQIFDNKFMLTLISYDACMKPLLSRFA